MLQSERYFAYIRVSTLRQGQTGTSLAEQRAAIAAYARSYNLTLGEEFEERETAAKLGRPVFLKMVKALRAGRARGVIMHKIDRSARNLKDWANLGELIDNGVEVLFANETLDLSSRGGRLSADIQAVIAADFIRNLREETKKGIYGRLKQGLYPFRAMIGYRDMGSGKPKELDTEQAPLVRQAFELYATGSWGLNALVLEMNRRGLRSRSGKKITRNGLATILHNPFYTGVILIKKRGELFSGQHPPIVSKQLFDEVQSVLDGKNIKKKQKHSFVFSRHIICQKCQGKLIAERQKKYVYYRCHTQGCGQKCLREDYIEERFIKILERLQFSKEENEFFKQKIEQHEWAVLSHTAEQKQQFTYEAEQVRERLSILADAYIDKVFDERTYKEKKNALILKERELVEKLVKLNNAPTEPLTLLNNFVERLNSAQISYQKASSPNKRELAKTVTSNFEAAGKIVTFKLNLPFEMVVNREVIPVGSPYGATSRTFEKIFRKLLDYFTNQATAKSEE